MNCEETSVLFEEALDRPDGPERRRVMQHLATCEGCNDAFRAVACLRAERHRPVPEPSPGAADRALSAATRAQPGRRPAAAFWSGLAIGALAAGLAAVSILLIRGDRLPVDDSFPEVTMALHQPRDVSIAIDAPVPLQDAEIRVSLRGAVDLLGFEGQRDIRWTTTLARGLNELTLPVVATGRQGGQVQVVVQHGDRQKAFVVDVHIAGRQGAERKADSDV